MPGDEGIQILKTLTGFVCSDCKEWQEPFSTVYLIGVNSRCTTCYRRLEDE